MFDRQTAKAMLTGREGPAFDDPDFIFELKLDGDRCLAYLSGSETVLINKRGRYLVQHLPELAGIHTQVKGRCILDGELIIGSGYKHEFAHLRSRLATTDRLKREREARAHPATFLAFDILYLDDREVLDNPLLERKALLQATVAESPSLALARYISGQGRAFFDLVTAQGLEGIMAKRGDSVYRMGKRSKDWMKCKNWDRDAFVICGYAPSEKANVASLVLGQYQEDVLAYVGHVVLGRATEEYRMIASLPPSPPVLEIPLEESRKRGQILWISPVLVCQVEFMCRTLDGGLRQPVYKGLLPDYEPEDAVYPEVFACASDDGD